MSHSLRLNNAHILSSIVMRRLQFRRWLVHGVIRNLATFSPFICINNILGKKDRMRYNVIPSVIYTNPEVGSVGETEESAKQKGLNVKTVSIPMTYSGRYIAENTDLTGICKLVVNNATNTLIGAHIIGSYAGEFIVAVSAMIDLEVDIENIKKLVFPHPTVSEIVREAIFQI